MSATVTLIIIDNDVWALDPDTGLPTHIVEEFTPASLEAMANETNLEDDQ